MRIAVVGAAGHQGQEYVTTIRSMPEFELVAVVDRAFPPSIYSGSQAVGLFTDLAEALDTVDFEVALVAVPHNEHFKVTSTLLKRGKWVFKEKPLAATRVEAEHLASLASAAGTGVITLTQRMSRGDFTHARDSLGALGTPYWYSYTYELALAEPTSGWRAVHEIALGGVVLDMGYHILDVIVELFGAPDTIDSSVQFRYPPSVEEQLEDLAAAQLHYTDRDLSGSMMVARHSSAHTEHLVVHGTQGVLELEPRAHRVKLFDIHGDLERVWTFDETPEEVLARMLRGAQELTARPDCTLRHMRHHAAVVASCEKIYLDAAHHRSRVNTVS